MALAGAALAPDSLATWLLVVAWLVTMTAFNSVFGKVRTAVRERQIREEERARLQGPSGPRGA